MTEEGTRQNFRANTPVMSVFAALSNQYKHQSKHHKKNFLITGVFLSSKEAMLHFSNRFCPFRLSRGKKSYPICLLLSFFNTENTTAVKIRAHLFGSTQVPKSSTRVLFCCPIIRLLYAIAD